MNGDDRLGALHLNAQHKPNHKKKGIQKGVPPKNP
jgi:hypothetical protein